MERTSKTYQDAKQNCKIKFGGHGKLYEPLTWSENQMAYKIAKATDGTVNWWIGVNDRQTEGSFVYESNGTPISYTPKFYPSFGSRGTSRNCILYNPAKQESDIVNWIDFQCTGCVRQNENPTDFKIVKEPLLVQRQTLHQQKALVLCYLEPEAQGSITSPVS